MIVFFFFPRIVQPDLESCGLTFLILLQGFSLIDIRGVIFFFGIKLNLLAMCALICSSNSLSSMALHERNSVSEKPALPQVASSADPE